jgi:hypothetical protein
MEVRSTARLAIHLQFDISANAFEIREMQRTKYICKSNIDCTRFDTLADNIILGQH